VLVTAPLICSVGASFMRLPADYTRPSDGRVIYAWQFCEYASQRLWKPQFLLNRQSQPTDARHREG